MIIIISPIISLAKNLQICPNNRNSCAWIAKSARKEANQTMSRGRSIKVTVGTHSIRNWSLMQCANQSPLIMHDRNVNTRSKSTFYQHYKLLNVSVLLYLLQCFSLSFVPLQLLSRSWCALMALRAAVVHKSPPVATCRISFLLLFNFLGISVYFPVYLFICLFVALCWLKCNVFLWFVVSQSNYRNSKFYSSKLNQILLLLLLFIWLFWIIIW